MKHIDKISGFIRTLINSDTFHALVIESPPGLGKSSAIDSAMNGLKMNVAAVGSYATPLHIYNTICKNPHSVIVIDDCASMFNDQKALAVLKAATWGSSGYGEGPTHQKPRRITWGSSSDKVESLSVDFSGKIIILTNVLPKNAETLAFLSRCLVYRIHPDEEGIRAMLKEAALSKGNFPKQEIAIEVLNFIFSEQKEIDFLRVNFRTLRMGYDLALTNPEMWKELFRHVLPTKTTERRTLVSPHRSVPAIPIAIRRILSSDLPVKEQEKQFSAMSGMSRRTFFSYKRRLGLSRKYHSRNGF